jgi:tRNA threonylcarbamoyladenosine biosynthesis protein TsaB
VKLLAFDTAGPVVGVACLVDGEVRTRSARIERAVDAVVLVWAGELLAEAGLSYAALDGVCVAAGPGTFTGLRVGLATASGLAFALGVPLWSGDALASRAARVTEGRVLAMLDARKARVYASWFEGGVCVRGPVDIAPLAALAGAAPGFIATGEGAVVYEALVRDAGGVLAAGADDCAVDLLARQGAAALAHGGGARALDVRPVYLRDADVRLPRS